MNSSKDLCSSCGMCCDGTLFPYFRINNDERELFSTREISGIRNVPQPCEHFIGCSGCKIYQNRPNTCSEYKCPVLKGFEGGKLSYETALEYIDSLKNDKDNKEKKSEFLTGKVII
jgi:uncharacterized protein